MKISFVKVHNFRKLQDCLIELSDTTTVFVGANNSGKTSAINALEKFLGGIDYKIVFNDIFISHRTSINTIGKSWVEDDAKFPDNLDDWYKIMPALDICFSVHDDELRHVAHIIPTLKWKGGDLGIRLAYQPKKIEELFTAYKTAYTEARKTENIDKSYEGQLYPQSLCDFLKKNLDDYFGVKAYILDPSKLRDTQNTSELFECSERNPLQNLIKVHTIPAQRGFKDIGYNSKLDKNSLSAQLRNYYETHLDPEKGTSQDDLKILKTMANAAQAFDDSLKQKFKKPLSELEALGYPGINDPEIVISTKVTPIESLKHDTSVQYRLEGVDKELMLPEQQNGLGYQNLISIVFTLMRYRDEWIKVGKAKSDLPSDNKIEPIHLVLLEEPEAHLHVQVQQVFIQQAYNVLTNLPKEHTKNLHTQLLISTHSSHIAKETLFANMRYFKRFSSSSKAGITKVVNLSDVFGEETETAKFVTRYLKSTHCDLFFADAIIAIEGTSEAILLPHFIKEKFPSLASRYISVLNVGGKHIHRFEGLLNKLALPTLVIADIDTGEKEGRHKKVEGKRNEGQVSTNYAVYSWIMNERSIDKLIVKTPDNKIMQMTANDIVTADYQIRVAYQTPIDIDYDGKLQEVIPRTFEDSLIYTNWKLIAFLQEQETSITEEEENPPEIKIDLDELMKEVEKKDDLANEENTLYAIREIYNDSTNKDINELHKKIFEYVNSQNFKASFALDIMYEFDPSEISLPQYIEEGFCWLDKQLEKGE